MNKNNSCLFIIVNATCVGMLFFTSLGTMFTNGRTFALPFLFAGLAITVGNVFIVLRIYKADIKWKSIIAFLLLILQLVLVAICAFYISAAFD